MESNPYLQLQSDENPYLSAALSREADSHLIQNLLGLVPEPLPEQSLGAAQGVYQSALEVSPDSSDADHTSATGTSQPNPYQSIPAQPTPAQSTPSQPIARGQHNVAPNSSSDGSRGTPLTSKKLPVEKLPVKKPPVETLYRSPEAVLRETARQQQQEQERSQQAAIQQQRLEQEQKQQATAAQHQLELRARAFLRNLNALDPLDSERMWFESFAEHCPSRLEAAIELIKTAQPQL